jgi:diguanylate cyclase (GGDEF)-like protein/PAS domain S-box-containing protein
MPVTDRLSEQVRSCITGRAEIILDSIGDAVLTTDLTGNITYLNGAAEAMTGWSRREAAGLPLDDVFHLLEHETRTRAHTLLPLAAQLDHSGLTAMGILVGRNARETAIEQTIAPIREPSGLVAGVVIVFRDVGTAWEMSRLMAHLAHHDVLTGLPNRLLLDDRLTQAIALERRRTKPLAVLFLDIDDFKNVNDSLGHMVGDQLLRSIAARLTGALRPSDTVSRVGGDEFVVVLSEIERSSDVAVVAAKILRAIAGPHRVGSLDISVTASVGVAVYPDHGDAAAILIARADTAMYCAKRAGAGTYRVFELVTRPLAPATAPRPLTGWAIGVQR